MSYPDEEVRPRKRRGRKVLIGFLVLLVLLVILATVVDRYGASYAERRIADQVAAQIADQNASSARPDVDVTGFPFVTQVFAGHYDRIDITVRDLKGTAQDKTVQMPVVDIQAQDVKAPLDTVLNRSGSIVAGTVTGNATIDYPSVVALMERKDVQLSEKDGKLAVAAKLEGPNNISLAVTGTANLTVQNGALAIRFENLSAPELAAIPFAQNLVNNYAKQLSITVNLPKLPLGLTVQKVTPTAAGLMVTATATDVPLNSGGF